MSKRRTGTGSESLYAEWKKVRFMWIFRASVYLPQGNSMKIYKAKNTLFHTGRYEWLDPYPDAGTAAENDSGDTIPWRAQQGTYRNGEDDRSVCLLGGGRQESVSV